MKMLFVTIGSSLLLCSCNATSTNSPPAIDSIQPGKESTWKGLVLRVDKRSGTKVEGIRLVAKGSDGKEINITAPKGSISSVPDRSGGINDSVRITLYEPLMQTGNTKSTQTQMQMLLVK
jgi:hypothetical protein